MSPMATEDNPAVEYLISQSTHTCLTVIRGTGVDDAIIGLAKCHGGTQQQWYPQNGQWHWGKDRSLCLSKDEQTGVVALASCDSSSALGAWLHDEEYRMILNSKALAVPLGKPRIRVAFQQKKTKLNQKWWTLSQLQKFVESDDLIWEHCLPSSVLAICKRELNRASSGTREALEEPEQCSLRGDVEISALEANGQDTISEEPEYLISQSTYTCLSVLNSASPGDSVIGVAPYTGDARQQWIVKDGLWQWSHDCSYCLASDPNEGGSLHLALTNGASTSWTLTEEGLFTEESSSRTLDVPLEGERRKVVLHPQHGGITQKWWLHSKIKRYLGRSMYPFPAKDKETYRREIARGLVNRLWPLSEPLLYPRAVAHYPGTVPPHTKRINMFCTLNVGAVQQRKNIRMRTPQDWQATNMYVVAGDIFTITLPETVSKKQAKQIAVRVGAQSDQLSPSSSNVRKGSFKRMPIISEEFNLKPGVTRMRSQFGGNLIFSYKENETFQVTAEVNHIVEAPHFILGKNTMTEWVKMMELKVPFSILEANRVVLVVPTKQGRNISDVDALLYEYDDILEKLDDLAGFGVNDPPPQGKQWLVEDIQITGGSAHAGFPIMFSRLHLALPKSPHSWGVWHELGHNYQQGPFWSRAYGIETTVNLFSLFIQEKLKIGDRLRRKNKYQSTAKAVNNGLTFKRADGWQKLVFLMEVKHAFPEHGWDVYRRLNHEVRLLSDEEVQTLKSSQQKKYDFVYQNLSRYVGADLIPHYKRWSLPISEEAQNKVCSLGLPKCPQNLSVYCPTE